MFRSALANCAARFQGKPIPPVHTNATIGNGVAEIIRGNYCHMQHVRAIADTRKTELFIMLLDKISLVSSHERKAEETCAHSKCVDINSKGIPSPQNAIANTIQAAKLQVTHYYLLHSSFL